MSSRALKIPYVALRIASHSACKVMETGASFFLTHCLNESLIENFLNREANDLPRLAALNIQSYLAIGSLISSNISSEKNLKEYKSTQELRSLLHMTGDLSVSTDILVS